MKFAKFIIITLLSVVAVTFSLSNRSHVLISFFPLSFTIELPLFLVMFISFLAGIILGGTSSLMNNLKLRRANKSARKQAVKLEKELDTLKSKTEINLI